MCVYIYVCIHNQAPAISQRLERSVPGAKICAIQDISHSDSHAVG